MPSDDTNLEPRHFQELIELAYRTYPHLQELSYEEALQFLIDRGIVSGTTSPEDGREKRELIRKRGEA